MKPRATNERFEASQYESQPESRAVEVYASAFIRNGVNE